MGKFVQYRNSFWGYINDIPEIYVDNFEDKKKKAYFLSHFHSDHYGGLIGERNAVSLQKNGGKIYMTEETRIIFKSKNPSEYSIVKDLITVLEAEQTYTNLQELNFDVTLISVDHMPGAVMFLFRTEKRTILYTGDFVIAKADIKNIKALHNEQGRIKLNLMYYDASFKDNEYLPDRNVAVDKVSTKIKKWLAKDPNNKVTLAVNYDFGYEELYKGIWKRLDGEMIGVTKALCNIYSELFKNAEPFYSHEETRIKAIKAQIKNIKKEKGNIIIAVSALNWTTYINQSPPLKELGNNNWALCYPTHNSWSTLKAFRKYFMPERAAPFSVKLKAPKFLAKLPDGSLPIIASKDATDDIQENIETEPSCAVPDKTENKNETAESVTTADNNLSTTSLCNDEGANNILDVSLAKCKDIQRDEKAKSDTSKYGNDLLEKHASCSHTKTACFNLGQNDTNDATTDMNSSNKNMDNTLSDICQTNADSSGNIDDLSLLTAKLRINEKHLRE